jgi:hypothetical protein
MSALRDFAAKVGASMYGTAGDLFHQAYSDIGNGYQALLSLDAGWRVHQTEEMLRAASERAATRELEERCAPEPPNPTVNLDHA